MIEKRLVQWYASDSGVDLDIAEREIALTYVLHILADGTRLKQITTIIQADNFPFWQP